MIGGPVADLAVDREAPPAPCREGEERDGRGDRRPRPEDALRHEVEDAREGQRGRYRPGDRLAVPFPQDVVLVPLAEAQPVVRGGGEEEDEGRRSAQKGRVVDVALEIVQSSELGGEGDGEEEAEEDGGARDERPQLLEELAELALLERIGALDEAELREANARGHAAAFRRPVGLFA